MLNIQSKNAAAKVRCRVRWIQVLMWWPVRFCRHECLLCGADAEHCEIQAQVLHENA